MGYTFGNNLASASQPAERVEAAHVTPGFFAMAGIPPRLGRGFEGNTGTLDNSEAIVSDALWRGYLHADSGILGKTITLDGKPLKIVGVMPRGFIYPDGADVAIWLPDAVSPADTVPGKNPERIRLIGRLKAGVTLEQARADLERIARGMDHEYPAPFGRDHAGATVRVISLQKELTADSSTAAAVLMGAVGFLLLIACANVANLFLARAVARRKEMATRVALGAARRDIVRMLISESLLLGVSGGALGTLLLFWGRRGILFLIPKGLAQGIPIDWRVLAFTAGCSMGAGLLFGLAPALQASRVDVNSGLKETDVRSRSFLPAFLTAGQIALSLVPLAGAGLMIRSFLFLAYMDPGFDAHNVLMASANLRPFDVYSDERQVQYADRMLVGIQRLPGIRYAAATSSPPMATFSELDSGMYADHEPRVYDAVSITDVSTQYFQALGIHLIAGRLFDARDGRGEQKVAIINQALARLLFQSRNPLGHRINDVATVVGVVADIHHRALDEKVWPELFRPYEQPPSPWVTVLVRGAGDPSALAPAIRRIAASAHATQPLFDVGLLEDRVSASLAERRERATILGRFCGARAADRGRGNLRGHLLFGGKAHA